MARARPRLLFLSQCLPYPPTSGVTNRTYHILRELQRAFDVSLIAFSRRNHQRDAAARRDARLALAALLSSVGEPVPVRSERSALAKLAVHLRSLASGECYVDYEYSSLAFGAQVESAVRAASPDLVHLDSLDLHRWSDDLGNLPITCTHHSIESELLRLRADHHANRWLRPYLRRQAARYAQLEREKVPGFALNVMMSDLDAARLRQLAPGARTICAPNGVDPDAIRPTGESRVEKDLVAFLGPAYMYPNRDGMEYFFDQVWPKVVRQQPSAHFMWIGRMSEEDRRRFERNERVECTGFVEDLEGALARAACLVVPLRIGGGTRLKILDAWAAGKAVVSTTVGCEGLASQDGRNIVIRDDSQGFADAVLELLADTVRRREIGTEARRTVETTYAWSTIGEHLNSAYLGLL